MIDESLRRARNVAGALWTRSPRDNAQRLMKRPGTPAWREGKHAKWNRLPYYLQLFHAAAAKLGVELSFEGKAVIEIGAGPVLGLIPFALIEGARAGAIVEPGWRELRAESGFRDEYLWPLFAMHSQLFAPRPMSLSEFTKAIDAVSVITTELEQVPTREQKFDVFLSKSCLEHIRDLDSAARAARALSSASAVHFHYVDFTMHREEDRHESPFGPTYRVAKADNPEVLTRRTGGVVNLLRPSEMIEIFRRHFGRVAFLPLEDWSGRVSLSDRHPDWSTYEAADLSIANGLLVAAP